ncbi:hypothetical protein SAR11G3_01040 [Candidatus Pelagibacter sp. IMCC9063]|nr:hypothetical protein SAR11G3_01040 [Candidatus Pelagibacter sp. IMCC9063]
MHITAVIFFGIKLRYFSLVKTQDAFVFFNCSKYLTLEKKDIVFFVAKVRSATLIILIFFFYLKLLANQQL